MKIAQLAPLTESIPPRLYGGTERVVSYLTEELVHLGHDVTLFASGDSETGARLEAICPQALRLDPTVCDRNAYQFLLLERAFRQAEDFDLIHSHLDYWAFPWASRCQTPLVTTLHGRLDLPEIRPLHGLFDMALVSISDAQRRPLPDANWVGTVHHGLPRDLYHFQPGPGQYLAFLGRMAAEKRPDHAIALAKRLGMPLKIAAKVDPADREYFNSNIAPLLDHPVVEYVGEVSDADKQEFLGNASALVAPFDWPEPFGMVFIEALACGTPVLAYRRGSIPELIDNGMTGYVCNTFDEMGKAVSQIDALDRRACRQAFEARFTVERMAQDYLRLYEETLEFRPMQLEVPRVANF